MCPKDKSPMFNCRLLERISGDVILDMIMDTSKDKTLFTSLNCPLCSISRVFQGGVFVNVISRDMIPDRSSDISTKQVVAMVNCNMMSLVKVRNFYLSRMEGCKSYYILFI